MSYNDIAKKIIENEDELNKLQKKINLQEFKILTLKTGEFLKNEELKKINEKDLKIEEKEKKEKKENDDFLQKIYNQSSKLNSSFSQSQDVFSAQAQKVEKIEVEKLKVEEKTEKIEVKIGDLSTNSNLNQSDKQKLFDELEKDILNLKLVVEKLKKENLDLKKELELILEKEKLNAEKSGLKKENQSVKDKIEALKNKTQNTKKEFESDTKNLKNFDKNQEKENIKSKTIRDDIKFLRDLSMADVQNKTLDNFSKDIGNLKAFKATGFDLKSIVNYAQDFDDFLQKEVEKAEKMANVKNKITYDNNMKER
ncbi:hypothetical protein [Aliarcobacter butzleri]|uniref:Viral A-type inclusion protein n=1 Tax=Aliarcobacter butzleri TaxID=28197 RepID=A0AAW6VIV3_9BACT|nr:hypothetical protein [Aliarcobacter butzleri]MDK2042068.1 hypothetical protein [Aliarcobacter butzleri]MDK2097287.1 hypothetical protein [Aliarcobacter butzleri]